MRNYKLKIDLIPKGAWGNNLRTCLSKNDWELLREKCIQIANNCCQICGTKTNELDAHEVWEFNIKNKTQTLKDIIGICNKCHGVIHYRNSVRLGFGENAKKHFMKVNNASALDFATHLTQSLVDFEERNKIFRWKLIADIDKFGLQNAEIKERNIPFIKNPYENVDWNLINYEEKKSLFESIASVPQPYWSTPPKVISISVDNYQGIIKVVCNNADRIEWLLDDVKIKTQYNVVGKYITNLKVEGLKGKHLKFKLIGDGGETISKIFELTSQEVI